MRTDLRSFTFPLSQWLQWNATRPDQVQGMISQTGTPGTREVKWVIQTLQCWVTEEATISPTCSPPLHAAFPWLPIPGTDSRVATVQPWKTSHFFRHTLFFMYKLSFGHSETLLGRGGGRWARQYCKFGNDLREFRLGILGPITEQRQDPRALCLTPWCLEELSLCLCCTR